MYSRTEKYGSWDTYYTSGNTAICFLNSFFPSTNNYEVWKAFYNGNADKPTLEEYPDDPVLVLMDSLEKAKSDPNIENFVIDISLNVGGSVDAVMFVTSLLMNKTKFYMKNTLTGQTITTTYEIDRNLDGKFDASDDVISHNLNIAILESRIAYSCGNLFPAIMKDEGYPILGETSGGGTCGIQEMISAEGLKYNFSSHRCYMTNKAGEGINNGVEPTIPIEIKPDIEVTSGNGAAYTIPDYSNFWDIDLIRSKVNEFYQNKQ